MLVRNTFSSILVVDSDSAFRDQVAHTLGGRGHRMAQAAQATEALALATRETFGVIIIELALPGIDGLSLVSRLREREPDQEIILVTEKGDRSAALTAVRSGVADYLARPFEEPELILAVERCLDRADLRSERNRLSRESEELGRSRRVVRLGLELVASSDLEWIQERVLADLLGLCDAQTAAFWLADDEGTLRLKSYRGLVDRSRLADVLRGDEATEGKLKGGQPWRADEGRSMWVPLAVSGEVLGAALVSDPLAGRFGDDALTGAELLASFTALAVRNGRRMLALQRLGLRDRETAAYHLSYFTDYASKEIYKARRYGRIFTLLVFSIDNLALIKSRLSPDAAQRASRGVMRALSRIVRDSDVVAKASEHEFYVLLPETDFFGSIMFLTRAAAAVRDEEEVRELEERVPLGLVGGGATYPKDGEDFDELVHRCRARMDERRVSLHRRLQLDMLPFWDVAELLLGNPGSPQLPGDEKAPPSSRGGVGETFFEELQAEMAREILRDPSARGLVYLGVPEVRAELPLLAGLERVPPELATRVYVLGRRAGLRSHPAATPVYLEGDERVARGEFVLWASENGAYGLVQRRGKGAAWAFHTSDSYVVESLITKLQAEYDLQPY